MRKLITKKYKVIDCLSYEMLKDIFALSFS